MEYKEKYLSGEWSIRDWRELSKSRNWSSCLCKFNHYKKLLEKEWGIEIDKKIFLKK